MNDALFARQVAERMVTGHMARIGASGICLTHPGDDDGLDVLADGVVAQIIIGRTWAGKPLLQRLRHAAAHRRVAAIAYSGVGFSSSAERFASQYGIALFTIHQEGGVTANNDLAKRLTTGAGMSVLSRLEPEPARRRSPLTVLSLPFANGRWYFYVCVLSWGLLAFVPFVHGFARLRDHWARRMAGLFGALPVVFIVALVGVDRFFKLHPARDPLLGTITLSPLFVGIVACFLLRRLRREVYHLDGT